jgi:uncharacterized protein (TIGR03437 family)
MLPVASTTPFILPGQVKNAASNSPLAAARGGLAQGSYFAIYGTGLGPADFVSAPLPYPTTLGGSSVTITPAGGSPVQAFLTYASERQINAILPSNVPLGDANVTVTYSGNTSLPQKIRVVHTSFAVFSTGYPVGAAATININTSSLYNLLTNSANGGDVLLLFGTGLGPIAGGDNVAPGAVSPSGIDVKVLVAGQEITPVYAGRSAEYPALDQINFVLPSSGIPDGCFVPIAVSVNGAVSNYGTLAKATGGRVCIPPLGLNAASLAKLDQGGTINIGQLSLSRSTIQATIPGLSTLGVTTEQAGAAFGAVNGGALFGLTQTPGAVPPLNVPGTCIVQTIDAISPPTTAVASLPQPLNAGTSLTLSGPASKTKDLPRQGSAGYGAFLAQASNLPGGLPVSGLPGVPNAPTGLPASFIEAGAWSIRGAGGADIGAFTANITVPTPLNCTNCGTITSINRSQPLTISWTGGGGNQDYVQIGGFSTTPSLADPSSNVAVIFSCTARASDNVFTVPANVLSQLPENSGSFLSGEFGVLTVVNGLGSSNATFTAPNLDFGYFGYTSILTRLVGYQ